MEDIPKKIKALFEELGKLLTEEYPNQWIVLNYHRLPDKPDEIIIAASDFISKETTKQ